MALRDAVTDSGPESVLKTAKQDEDYAVRAYEKALTEDIPADTQAMAQRQLAEIRTARAEPQRLLETITGQSKSLVAPGPSLPMQ